MTYGMYLIITNKLGFGGTHELEVTKVNTRKVDGLLNLLGSQGPLKPFDKANEMTRAIP